MKYFFEKFFAKVNLITDTEKNPKINSKKEENRII